MTCRFIMLGGAFAALLAPVVACSGIDAPPGGGSARHPQDGGSKDPNPLPDSGACDSGSVDAADGGSSLDASDGTADAASGDCFETGCPSQHVCKALAGDAGVGSCVFVPDPPAHCMAPCVWEVRKNCLPVMGQCVRSSTYYETAGGGLCSLQTDWRTAFEYYHQGNALQLRQSTFKGEARCFSTFDYFPMGNGPRTTYSGPSSVVATVWGYPAETYCDSADPLATLATNYYPRPDVPHYPYDPTAADCVSWLNTYLAATDCLSFEAPMTPVSPASLACPFAP